MALIGSLKRKINAAISDVRYQGVKRTFIQISENGGFELGLNIRYGKIDWPFYEGLASYAQERMAKKRLDEERDCHR
jgi:hypothetical protein